MPLAVAAVLVPHARLQDAECSVRTSLIADLICHVRTIPHPAARIPHLAQSASLTWQVHAAAPRDWILLPPNVT